MNRQAIRHRLVTSGAVAAFIALLSSQCALASSVTLSYLEGQVPVAADAYAAYGPDLFGDKVNLYNGALTFEQTDLSLPGNSALPVALARRFTPGQHYFVRGQFGDWDLDVPRISGTFGWPGWVTYGGGTNRCTSYQAPPAVGSDNGLVSFNASDYWQGNTLYVPGQGAQEVLRRAPDYAHTPQDGTAYPLVTHNNWQIGCLSSLRNAAGEGFVAVSPDGVHYRFDWLAERYQNEVRKLGGSISRKDVFLYATEVTDRFGNWVRYTYDPASPMSLQRIESNDGRLITVQNSAGRITSASDGTRTLLYSYAGLESLSQVQLPDGSRWTFNLGPMFYENQTELGEGATCDSPGAYSLEPLVGTMTHPSGEVGTFSTRFQNHGRHYVDRVCKYPPNNNVRHYAAVWPKSTQSQTLRSKTITGPGLPALTWSYTYSGGSSWSTCTNCPDTKTVSVTDPLGQVTLSVFGNRWRVNEGQLLQLHEGWNGSSALRSTAFGYRQPAGQNFPEQFGVSVQFSNDWLSTRHRPQDRRTVTQQGSTFTWQVDASAAGFDLFARPLAVSKFSSLGHARTESTAYHDNMAKWVMGQLASINDSGLMREQTSHDATTAMPTAKYSFGRLMESFSYYGDGGLYQRLDPVGRATTYADYWRGIPRHITHRNGSVETASVDNLGHVTAYTNAAGTTRSYGYDSMGRLASIGFPAESWGGYHPTTIAFEPVGTEEYGIGPGHWRQTVSSGNARTVRYLDALWRVGLTRRYDAANEAGTSSFVEVRYNPDGQKVFEGYPQRNQGALGSAPGQTWYFDALGRSTALRRDSELGPLDTVTDYLGGFQRRTTNPRGHATTTAFQAFDTPSEDAPVAIWAPEGVGVNISRDAFGKPTAITRGGAFSGSGPAEVTRRYVYDAHQRLCKTVEPESGATMQNYDAAGNVAWRASGQPFTSTAGCDSYVVPGASLMTFGYDAVDRLIQTNYGDGSPGITRSYTPDGLLSQITSSSPSTNPIGWHYEYNNRRLLKREQYTWGDPNNSWNFLWDTDAHGNVGALTDPWGTMAYAPNALGQPTQVSGYASSVVYHPSGAVASYMLSNGISHNMLPNVRGLPMWWHHSGVSNDQYAYDPNGNVTSITDHQEGGATSRSMGYDGLDRLTVANGIWGSGSYSYDALDNLRTAVVGSRNAVFNYDATNKLASGVINGGSVYYNYDLNGNLSSRAGTALSDQTFSFDIGNRLSSTPGRADYLYDGHGRRNLVWFAGDYMHQAYTKDGKLRFAWRLSQGGRRHVYLGDRLIAETVDGGATTFMHTDALGSPVASTNQSGQVLTRTRYEPYGATAAGTNPTRIGFTGHVNDADTGLVYMEQRYYDPVAGRFLSVDPVTTDGHSGSNFNRYLYAKNNPYAFIDPDGRDSVRPNWIATVGFSATLFNGVGLGILGSDGRAMQGFSVSISVSVNIFNPQFAVTVAGNELKGAGLYAGGGAVLGGGINNGAMTSGTSEYHSFESGVGIGPVSAGGQLATSKDSMSAAISTRAGVGAGAYVANGPGSQTTLATPTLSDIKSAISRWSTAVTPSLRIKDNYPPKTNGAKNASSIDIVP